jgi:hypothetical protein
MLAGTAVTVWDSNQLRRFPCLPEIDCLPHKIDCNTPAKVAAPEMRNTRESCRGEAPFDAPTDRRSSPDTRAEPTEQGTTRTKRPNGPPHLAGPETGQLAAFTYLMDDANAVPGTVRNRYPW